MLYLCCTLLTLLAPCGSQAGDPVQEEYRVKAAFLYNFARFTNWPANETGTFHLCILGINPFDGAVDSLRDKTVHDQPLSIVHITSAMEAAQCQLLYISPSLAGQLNEIIPVLGRFPALTVSDIDGFIGRGGIIGFLVIDDRIRFEINITAASEAGLSISSKLLSLATTVKSGR